MNRRQEIVLWTSGLLLSAFVFIRFKGYYVGVIKELVEQALSKGGHAAHQTAAYATDIRLLLASLFMVAIPFTIISSLIFISVRNRQ